MSEQHQTSEGVIHLIVLYVKIYITDLGKNKMFESCSKYLFLDEKFPGAQTDVMVITLPL